MALEELVADLVVRRRQQIVVAAALLHELHHLRPLAEAHAELEREVAAVHLAVELRRRQTFEVHRHLGRLLLRVEQLELLDELNPEVVLALHEHLLGDGELELLERRLAHRPPQPRVRLGVEYASLTPPGRSAPRGTRAAPSPRRWEALGRHRLPGSRASVSREHAFTSRSEYEQMWAEETIGSSGVRLL